MILRKRRVAVADVEDKASVSKSSNNDIKEGERSPLNSNQVKASKIRECFVSLLRLDDDLHKKTRPLRHSKEKKQENVSDRRTRQTKNKEEISQEITRSILCSTPMKPKCITLEQNDVSLSLPTLSPISSNTRPIEEKESPSLRCEGKDDGRKVHEDTEDSSLLGPLCPKRRTYSSKQVSKNLFHNANGNSSNENEDPYSLFSRPTEGKSSGGRKKAKPAKVKSNKMKKKPLASKQSNKDNEEFLNWCQIFSKDLEEIDATELLTD